MLLLIDNYDSFVFNLARYFERLGQETIVVRNDGIHLAGVRELAPDAIVLSPGPCTPQEAGISLEVVRELSSSIPMLGVCLGHQTIAAAFGAKIVRAANPMHGRTSSITHDGRGVFADLPNPLTVCRYHSLVVDPETLPSCFEVTAQSDDDVVMGLRHRDAPIIGVQFHPESILTDSGFPLLSNFLALAGLASESKPTMESELTRSEASLPLPDAPVTF